MSAVPRLPAYKKAGILSCSVIPNNSLCMETKMEFDFTAVDKELDFDLDDFQFDINIPEEQENVRILPPRMDIKTISHKILFENAEMFADQIDLSPGARTFAWVSGNFIFGDIIEALITKRRVGIKKLYIMTLSISQENIDSLKNVMLLMGNELEKIVMVISGYQYSHEKYNLIPYLYQELDDPSNRFQVVFGSWHNKIICIETVHGHHIIIHGSANMRSSNSIEQLMVEVDDHDLYQFNADLIDNIADKFGTINHSADYHKLKRLRNKQAWETCKEVF